MVTILAQVDDFLHILGLQEISIVDLWNNATGDLIDQRGQLFGAVMSVLRAAQQDCAVLQ